jgi:isoleucyl-tRNA synthetase
MAPGFGEDDQKACEAAGIPVICPVDDRGRFTDEVPDYRGVQVFEANMPIVRELRARQALVRQDSYVHSYPHCWRTDTPLIYKAVTSWFVRVTAIRDRMSELNQEINWVPAHVRDGAFGKWLENAHDWSISRNRFWGSPIPVWKSDNPAYPRIDVYGSRDEMEADFGVRPTDLHRPFIDQLTRPNPDDPSGRSTMRRVSDVLDCWFESGSMPFAQVHYPFEHGEWFEDHFPGDFIVEYIGQTRGWFYTLHVLATALFDRPAFRTCMAHGVLLGDDGQKMSKRLRNYPDPEAMFVKHGADAMRWFLLSSPVLRGGDMAVKEQGIRDAVRSAIHPLWNAWYFFTLYANADAVLANSAATSPAGVLDRYILAKLQAAVTEVTVAMDGYDVSGACSAIEAFLDALTNWYIRRSRNRFWGVGASSPSSGALRSGSSGSGSSGSGSSGNGSGDQQAAFDTLATVLEVLCRTAAPLLPLVTESVWRGLTGGDSVHLTDWPDASTLPADPELVAVMDRVRQVCSAVHSVRKAQGLRARLPLASLTVAAADAASLAPFEELIKDEVNVKELRLTTSVADVADQVLTVVFRVAAPRLGPDTQRAAAAARSGDWEVLGDGRARVGPVVLEPGEWELRLTPRSADVSRVLPGDDGVVILDVDLTSELEAEGQARDLVRLVQQARREMGLRVIDRIALSVVAPAEVADAVASHEGWIAEQVLARSLVVSVMPESGPGSDLDSDLGSERSWTTGALPDGRTIAIRIDRSGPLES